MAEFKEGRNVLPVVIDRAEYRLVAIECTCGIVFGIPRRMKESLERTHERFYCPNGHRLFYPQETGQSVKIAEVGV
jgi:hypothetical protein